MSDQYIVVESCEQQADGTVALALAVREADDRLPWRWNERFRLVADGREWRRSGTHWHSTDGRIRATCTFGPPNGWKAGKPAKLVVEDWDIVKVPVRFAFADVPLP